jgi:hypothetical protein
MDGGDMERLVVTVLNIGETLIPSMCMLIILHAQDMHNHPIDELYLDIGLRVESSGFVSFVSNRDQRIDKNVLRNLLSW